MSTDVTWGSVSVALSKFSLSQTTGTKREYEAAMRKLGPLQDTVGGSTTGFCFDARLTQALAQGTVPHSLGDQVEIYDSNTLGLKRT